MTTLSVWVVLTVLVIASVPQLFAAALVGMVFFMALDWTLQQTVPDAVRGYGYVVLAVVVFLANPLRRLEPSEDSPAVVLAYLAGLVVLALYGFLVAED